MARTYTLTIGDRTTEVEVGEKDSGLFVRVGDATHAVSLAPIGDGRLFSLLLDGRSYEVYARHLRGVYDLLVGSELYQVEVERGRRRHHAARGDVPPGLRLLRSPMTGIVAEVAVVVDQRVERGAVLLVLESMKMNNELRAEDGAIVERIAVQTGQRVERGDLLLQVRTDVDSAGSATERVPVRRIGVDA